MNGITNTLNEFLGPGVSGTLGHALVGLIILIVGLVVVKIFVSILRKILSKLSFLHRKDADGTVTDLASPIASLVKAVLIIFVLLAVLQHFGLTDVLAPLRDMLGKFTAAIPNIIGAGVIGYAGWLIAKIASELVGVALGKVDQQVAERTGNDKVEVSKFGSAFVFIAILLPIIVAALGVLNIPAISEPASTMIERLMAAIPNIIGAAIILLVTYFVTRFVVTMLNSLLEAMHVNELPAKMGAESMFSSSFTLTRLIGGVIMFFAMLGAATAAVNLLRIEVISTIFAGLLHFGGNILVGAVILLIGNFLSTLAYNKLSAGGTSSAMANIARFAILGLVLAMGLRAMGLADNIVNMAFGFTLGSVAVAVALAFGLGGRDAAKIIADKWASKISQR
ncbi:mechanosensitive ion channel [Microbulbifer halophilus]|uniref:Small-conductance mechanosensitive channel n=1 Tax=Microbulbifer halophilus TaxID=453963 RepID=A0ABW5E9Q6_9GAMM|nr:mechanosensitive ion channel [Microbulbifer halophilus]MCW8125085.1 mechanosensitive ion channel [Microbulbifer halophilus]